MPQVIRHDLAESFWKKTFVQFADGLVNIFFGGRNAPLIIAIGVQWNIEKVKRRSFIKDLPVKDYILKFFLDQELFEVFQVEHAFVICFAKNYSKYTHII